MFGNMTIRKKLIGSMGLVLIISAAAITVALSGMRQIGEQFNVFMEREMVLGQEINTMYAQGLQMGPAVRNVILNPSDQTARKNFTTSEGGVAKALSSARELSKADPEITRTLDELAELRKRQAHPPTNTRRCFLESGAGGGAGQTKRNADLARNTGKTAGTGQIPGRA